MNKKQAGFTILELLVVMTIIGILAVLGIGGFRSAQIKARDSKRKNDLVAIGKALEVYYNDKGVYPISDPSTGGVLSMRKADDTYVNVSWGGSFQDPDNSATIYMTEFPKEAHSPNTYLYWSDGQSYQLYARLENNKDREIQYAEGEADVPDSFDVFCGSQMCNFGISSQNITPEENRSFADDS